MPSPDPIAPDRLEELLGGTLPEGEREARLQGLARELRADAAAAPPAVRARVRALAAEPPRHRGALPRRRAALAVAFVLLAVGALGAGLALRDEDGTTALDLPAAPMELQGGETVPAPAADGDDAGGGSAAPYAPRPSAVSGAETVEEAATGGVFAPVDRALDIELWMELRLRDADGLSDAAGEAMAIARELGGWVAGSEIGTDGNEGEAELALRVPVGRVEDAVVRLGELGTVTGQRVETQDLQAGIDVRDRAIERHERAIRLLELQLESDTLTPAEELRLELRVERRRSEIADLRRDTLSDRREAATSELTLALHTREAPAAKEDEGGAAAAAREALELLGRIAAVALPVLIVAGPLLLLALLLWIVLRARGRRSEARLLDHSAAPPPPSAPRI